MKLKGLAIKIIGIVLGMIILAVLISKFAGTPPGDIVKECQSDSDCVKAGCCHSKSCVPISNASDCREIMCTQECEPGTLDCGQGSCSCIAGECSAVFK